MSASCLPHSTHPTPLLVTLLLVLVLAQPVTPGATTTATRAAGQPALTSRRNNDGTLSPSILLPRADPGSGCDGSEGQWNCMTHSFQRCAAGLWSEVMQCADGTECSPAGLTYDFLVDFTGSGGGGGSSGAPGRGSGMVLPVGWGVGAVAVGAGVLLGV